MFSYESAWHRTEKGKTKKKRVYCNSQKKKKKWAARLGFSYILTSTDCLARIMLQQHRFCIYKGKIHVKLPNAFKCLLCNVLYICSVHFLLNLGADAKNYLFPRFMTESSESEILKYSMLKIQYKHESIIFFFLLEEKQDHTVFSNIIQCSWTECLSIWSTFWIIHLSQFVELTYAPFFPIQRAPPLFPKHCFETQV